MNAEHIRRQLYEFNTIYKETDAIYSELAKLSGLSNCAFWLMYYICEKNGKCIQKEICGQWTMSKQTVNSALKGLEKNGYITLTSSEEDKRSKYISLTDKGQKFAHEHIEIVFKLEQLALQKMSDEERISMIENNRNYQRLFQAETEQFLKANKY